MSGPRVSVILPAFRAQATIWRASNSVAQAVARSGLARDDVELVIASDDGVDYADLIAPDLNRRFAPIGPVRTGPGAARNRAMAEARGAFVAFLDADDTWSPDYLAQVLPLAERQGVAFAQTRVFADAREILRLPAREILTLGTIGESGASFHPVLRRDWAGPFGPDPAQDVLHTVEALALAGGSAPVAVEAGYELRLGAATVTRAADFSERVDRAYQRYADDILSGRTRVPEHLQAEAAEAFDAKRQLNQEFKTAHPGESFYHFVARTRPHLAHR